MSSHHRRLWGLWTRSPAGYCVVVSLLGIANMLFVAYLLHLVGVRPVGEWNSSLAESIAVGLLMITFPLVETWALIVFADQLAAKTRLNAAGQFAVLWALWLVLHVVLQTGRQGLIAGLAGWAFLLPYFRVREEGRKRAYLATAAVHIGINLPFALLMIALHYRR